MYYGQVLRMLHKYFTLQDFMMGWVTAYTPYPCKCLAILIFSQANTLGLEWQVYTVTETPPTHIIYLQ